MLPFLKNPLAGCQIKALGCIHLGMSNAFEDNVSDILDRGVECANDVVSLAIAGESLRRIVELSNTPDNPPPALVAYDAFLVSYAGDIHGGLEETLAVIMVDLDAYAHSPRLARDWETGTQLLYDIDETLSLAVAYVRMGRESKAWLADLASKTTAVVSYLMPQLGDLWQFAEDHELIYSDDPDHVELYGFWESLAWCAPTRIQFELDLRAWARRERLLGAARRRHDTQK